MAQIAQLQLSNKHVSDRPPRSRFPGISLLPAVVLSLVAHAVLLLALNLPRAAQAPRTALVVTLRNAPVERPAAAPPAPQAPVPAPPPVATRPLEAAAPPQPAPQPSPSPPQSPPVAASPLPRPPAIATPDPTFRPAEELARAPLPEGSPELGNLAHLLVGRRLRVSVWVDPLGAVRKAQVARNELTPEQAELLERALAQVHFTPARDQADAAAAAVLHTLLCFDDAGALDAASDECWKPQPPQAR